MDKDIKIGDLVKVKDFSKYYTEYNHPSINCMHGFYSGTNRVLIKSV
jgi:hypothetical protein